MKFLNIKTKFKRTIITISIFQKIKSPINFSEDSTEKRSESFIEVDKLCKLKLFSYHLLRERQNFLLLSLDEIQGKFSLSQRGILNSQYEESI